MTQKWQVINEDLDLWLNAVNYHDLLAGQYFHALFSDWTYNLKSIKTRYGKEGSAAPKYGTDGLYGRRTRGFMNQEWDGDIGYMPSTWRKLTGALHRGALTASFSHARTFDRLGSAQRAAGFELESSLFSWFYGSGNPTGTKHPSFEGYEYGNPLKPQMEPIIMAYAPMTMKVKKNNATRYGTGMYNFGEARMDMANYRYPGTFPQTHHPGCVQVGMKWIRNHSGSISGEEPGLVYEGQWRDRPPHDSPDYEEVPRYDCHPDCMVQLVDKAHYFHQSDFRYEHIEDCFPAYYAGKVKGLEREAFCDELEKKVQKRQNSGGWANDPKWADKLSKNNHPTLKPIALCKWIATLLLPPEQFKPRRILVPCSGTGSEMIGCLLAGWDEVVGIEITPAYAAIADVRIAGWYEFIRYGQQDVNAILDAYARSVYKEEDTTYQTSFI